MNTIIKQMSEDEKIIFIIEKIFCATDQDTSVTMEQVIEMGIKLGYTEDYPRGKEDGHPWIPRTSVMMGVGSDSAIQKHEVFELHRKKLKREGRYACFFYWVDRSKKHRMVCRKEKAQDQAKPVILYGSKTQLTQVEKENRVNQCPDNYLMIGGKLISKTWADAHPSKFQRLYGEAY